MKVTLFTTNKVRANYFINLLSNITEELNVVQECDTIFPGYLSGGYPVSEKMRTYFKKVNDAQEKLFGKPYIKISSKKINVMPILYGDLNKCSLDYLSDFLKSDVYIVFGSSYIKGDLVNFLIKNKAINIHMGISPYYRGTDCNFWALYDNNPHLVGSTIHMLSKGLDSGKILYHALSLIKSEPFEYTMSSVKSAFHSIYDKIKNNSLLEMKTYNQNKTNEIRYSRKNDFNDTVLDEYNKKIVDLNSKTFDKTLLINPYFYKN
jgi:folate-dependent phosphoribosylglycinamide formyltransferase PurN